MFGERGVPLEKRSTSSRKKKMQGGKGCISFASRRRRAAGLTYCGQIGVQWGEGKRGDHEETAD